MLINEAITMAKSSGKKHLNIGLSGLSVVKAKKAHGKSASKPVKSVHQWPNIMCFGHFDKP